MLDRISTLARERSAALIGVARSEGLTADEALEAVQEAFHTLLSQQLETLSPDPAGAAALLSTLVQNAARNLRRRHHRAKVHEAVEEAEALADDAPSVDQVLASAADREQLIACVGRLAEVQRKIVSLRILEELSGAEVGRALGLTAGHVAVLLHRAKRELAACMTGCPHGRGECGCAAAAARSAR